MIFKKYITLNNIPHVAYIRNDLIFRAKIILKSNKFIFNKSTNDKNNSKINIIIIVIKDEMNNDNIMIMMFFFYYWLESYDI